VPDENKDPVPYDRFKTVIDERNKFEADWKAATAAQTGLTAEREKLAADLKAAQDLSTSKMAELAGKLDAAEHDALRLRVAVGAGLPLDLAARLQGKTEDELKADAAKLVPLLKPGTPGVPPPPPPGGTPAVKALKDMTPAEIRANQKDILAGKVQ
jgi:hypothetical protein